MKSKPTFSLLSILLLLTVLGSPLLFSLTPVFANPACGAVLTTSTTLTANIGPCSGDGLTIGANSITLNCAGHTISGASGNVYEGIYLGAGFTKQTVKNCNVTGFRLGFYIASSSTTLTGNTANKNGNGFQLVSPSNENTLTGNTANSNTGDGFYLTASSNTLTGNTANNNGGAGFELDSSSSNTITGNTANNNAYGFLCDPGSSSNTLTKNTANKNTHYGYYDYTSSSSKGVPHWDTANAYGTTKAALSTTGDKGTGNGSGLAAGNPDISTATSPF